MMDLQPGDLCVVVQNEWNMVDFARASHLIGRHVILTRILDIPWGKCPPYWHGTGLPDWLAISYKSLRKIPPPALDDEETDELPKEIEHV